jgi:hypothetical protein
MPHTIMIPMQPVQPRPQLPAPMTPGEWALAQLDRLMSGQTTNRGERKDETPRY